MNSETQPIETNKRQSKQAYWNHQISQWQESGLSQVQYCRDNQLNKHTFIYWKSKFERQQSLHPLLPVTVRQDGRSLSASNHSGIVLSFNDRIHIQLEADFNPNTLSRLIDLLEARSCSDTI